MMTAQRRWKGKSITLLAFVISLAAFENIWGGRFYTSTTHVGHDFAGSALSLLEGKFWLDSNGFWAGLLDPPWFTPAWCTGAAFYADPQSLFYSPLQALALWFNPIQATHVSTLLFAVVGYWGSYALARKIFVWAPSGATVFAALGMANAFLPLRSAVGESGYQPFYLWTVLALALCWRNRDADNSQLPWPSIWVCLTLTAWLQFGFAGMMVPAFLATLLLCFLLVIFDKASLRAVIGRATLGTVLAILLNGSKIYEAVSLMRNFPRDMYQLPGFPHLTDAFLATAFAVLQPSEWTASFGIRKLAHVTFPIRPHEWALNFGLGALLLATLCATTYLVIRKRLVVNAVVRRPPWTVAKSAAFALCLILGAIPTLLLWDDGEVRSIVKQLPIINSTTWPMRWILIILPTVQLLMAAPVTAVLGSLSSGAAVAGTITATFVIWCGPLLEPVHYYLDASIQNYDPKPVIRAFELSRVGPPIPIRDVKFDPATPLSAFDRNNTMLSGSSQALCYNPLYGYGLEMLPHRRRLRDGPALSQNNVAESLISNPACLLHPKENSCLPGSGFAMSYLAQRVNAQRLLDRRPIEWNRPPLGYVLSVVSQLSLLALLLVAFAKVLNTTNRVLRVHWGR